MNLRQRLADERGMTLILAVGLLFVLSISVAAMVEFTSSNSRSASLSQGEDRAFAVAEAALGEALSRMSTDAGNKDVLPNPAEGDAPVSTTVSDGNVTGSGTYYGEYVGSDWTVYATGSVPNPTGGSPITRTVQTKMHTYVTTTPGTNDQIWKFVFTDAPTCTTLTHNSNSTVWSSPVYIKGNLCLMNNIELEGTPVMVGGTLTMNGGSSVGLVASPVQATILGGCTGGVPNPHTCTTTDRVWSNTGATSLTPSLDRPVFDATAMTTYYRNAQPGPARSCTTSSGSVPAFDNDYNSAFAAPNGSLTGGTAVNLTPNASYNCEFRDTEGNLRGQLSWTDGNPGTLQVLGSIYFDGDIAYTGNARYTGTGKIFATGRITFSNNAQLCVTTNCASTWDPDTHVLVLVSGSSNTSTSSPAYAIQLNNGSKFQGSLMTNGDYAQGNNAVTWASIVARQVVIDNSSNTYGIPDFTPPGGLPTTTQPFVSAEPIAGTYRG